MIELLIVDDDRIMTDNLRNMISWNAMGIERVFCACRADRAREIIQEQQIDILLCDIEMPGGSGLELAEWLHEQHLPIVTILLTCHSEFMYAQQALRLGCRDYLLKPIEKEQLQAVIVRTVEEVVRQKKQNQGREAEFWQEVAEARVHTSEEFQKLCTRFEISVDDNAQVLISLICWKYKTQMLRGWAPFLLEFVTENALKELFEGDRPVLWRYGKDSYVCLFWSARGEKDLLSKIGEGLHKFTEWVYQNYGCQISCYLSDFCSLPELPASLEKMVEYNARQVVSGKCFFTPFPERSSEFMLTRSQELEWKSLFARKKYRQMYENLEKWLSNLTERQVDLEIFRKVERKLWRLISEAFAETQEGKLEERLYGNGEEAPDIGDSLEGLLEFYRWVVEKMEQLDTDGEQDVVKQVQEYISIHIDREITREQLGHYVHLSPDHLGRLFRRQTNQSLNEYVNSEKLRVAKGLLQNTDMSVSEVAQMVGFTNFSYFSTLFKKFEGMSPAAYREKEGGL